MGIQFDKTDDGYVVFKVPVDAATMAWLCELAEDRGYPPALIAAAVLRDVREDDQRSHDVRPSGVALN